MLTPKNKSLGKEVLQGKSKTREAKTKPVDVSKIEPRARTKNRSPKSKKPDKEPEPRNRKKNPRSFVWAQEPWMSELLCALADAEGRQDTAVRNAFWNFEIAAKAFIETVRKLESDADFWETILPQWIDYYKGKRKTALIWIEKSRRFFPDPKRARDFLVCPPLDSGTIIDLMNGECAPGDNEYKKYVANQKGEAVAEAIYEAESNGPKDMFTYRLRVLRRDVKGETDSRGIARAASNGIISSELLRFEGLLKGEFDGGNHAGLFRNTWQFTESILPPKDIPLSTLSDSEERRRENEQRNEQRARENKEFRERIVMKADLLPPQEGELMRFLLKKPDNLTD